MFFSSLLCLGLLNVGLLMPSVAALSDIVESLASDKRSSLPFKFTHMFSANITLGPPSAPIAIPGGILLNIPLTGGRITGPGLNGSVTGGFTHPSIYNNGTLLVSIIDVYGMSDDGAAFYFHEDGLGSQAVQVKRISIDIGGGTKYDQIRNGYVLAEDVVTPDLTEVSVTAYLVAPKIRG